MATAEFQTVSDESDFLSKLKFTLDAIQKSLTTADFSTNKQKLLEEEITSIRLIQLYFNQDILIENELLSKIQQCIDILSKGIQNTDNCAFYASSCEIISSLLLIECGRGNYLESQCKITNIALATKMSLRAVTSWMALNDTANANKCLNLAKRCTKTMKDTLNGNIPLSMHRVNIEKYEVISTLCQIELLSVAGEYNQAFSLFSEIKAKTYEFQNLQNYLGTICYNNGIKCFRNGIYEWSVTWLRQCYGLLKEGCLNFQQQILKMLAEAYVEWDATQYWRKAVHAINLAYASKKSTEYFIDSLYIILRGGNEAELDGFITKIEEYTDISGQLFSTKIVDILLKFGYNRQALITSKALRKKTTLFSQLSCLLILELKMYLDSNNYKEGKATVEEYLKKLEEHKLISDFQPDHRVCLLCLEVASKDFKEENFAEALIWYRYCIGLHHLMTNSDKEAGHKYWLKRQECFCLVETNNLHEAKAILEELSDIEPGKDLNKLLELKIGFLLEDNQLVEPALNYFVQKHEQLNSTDSSIINPSNITKVIIECIHTALEKNKIEFPIVVLDRVLLSDEDLIKNYTMKIKLLQCLLRLHLTIAGNRTIAYDRCLQCITKSEACLDSVQQKQQITQECAWFAKICWNIATQKSTPISIVFQLFTLSWKFLHKVKQPNNVAVSTQKTNCLLMAVSAGLAIARESSEETSKETILRAVLNLLTENKKTNEITNNNKRVLQVILLYEFETRIMIKCSTLPMLFEEVTKLSELDAKFFELLATISVEHGLLHHPLTANALKMAIKKYSEKPIDFVQLSRNYHSLIQVTLDALMNNERDTYREALTYICQLLEFVHETGGGRYPEIELVWTMIKCWNCGIHYLLRQDDRSAYEWCSTSMKFLKYLGSFETVYGDKMTELFEGLFDGQLGSNLSLQ